MESWEDADDEDDWAVTPLAVDTTPAPAAVAADDEEAWCASTKAAAAPAPAPARPPAKDEPLLLVNFTRLSGGAIHNRNDPHACNDPEAKSALAKTLRYAALEADEALVAAGAVRRTSTRRWRDDLAALRVEAPGQYFAPVFP